MGAETTGSRVKALREAKGWSQEQLARGAGVVQMTVSKLERGLMKKPSHDTLSGIARALGVRVEELTGQANDALPPGPAPAPRVRVVMDADTAGDVAALESVLLALTATGSYELADFDAARTVVRETYRHLKPDAVEQHADALLRAAKGLRKEGKPATVTDILARMAYGPARGAYEAGAEERDRVNAEADAELRAKGYEPGKGRAAVEARLAQIAAKKRRYEEE